MSHQAAPSARRKRAVTLIRVSDVNGRDKTGKFVSPDDQRKINERICQQFNLTPVAEFVELNKSGYSRELKRRPGLRPAIEMVERGEAEVIVVGYFDRLFRKSSVKIEAFLRIQKAGGEFITGDLGRLETGSAAQRLNLNVMIAVAEFQAEQTKDKTEGPKRDAVAAGIPPFPSIPPGYRQDPTTRKLVVHEAEAQVVQLAFERRAEGASLIAIRDFLREHGINRSWRGAQELLKNRIYLGELHFGSLVNLNSHVAIIDAPLFRTVQRMRVTRGSRPESRRLFARQALVRCSECGGRMACGQQTKQRGGERRVYFDYRCSPLGDCPRRQTISAEVLEEYVVSYVMRAQAEGRWAPSEQAAAAEAALAVAQRKYDRFVRMMDDNDDDESVVREKKIALREARDTAKERLDALRTGATHTSLPLADGWDRLTLDQQRTILRGLIEQIVVSPGKGTARIDVKFFLS